MLVSKFIDEIELRLC